MDKVIEQEVNRTSRLKAACNCGGRGHFRPPPPGSLGLKEISVLLLTIPYDNLTPPRVQRTEDYTQSTDSVCNLLTFKLNYYRIQRVVK